MFLEKLRGSSCCRKPSCVCDWSREHTPQQILSVFKHLPSFSRALKEETWDAFKCIECNVPQRQSSSRLMFSFCPQQPWSDAKPDLHSHLHSSYLTFLIYVHPSSNKNLPLLYVLHKETQSPWSSIETVSPWASYGIFWGRAFQKWRTSPGQYFNKNQRYTVYSSFDFFSLKSLRSTSVSEP